uniref:Uncharacterized protein n=1 Tax=Arundo donax TaxID=35708 RepID=A0A0A9AIX2_ARUDO
MGLEYWTMNRLSGHIVYHTCACGWISEQVVTSKQIDRGG